MEELAAMTEGMLNFAKQYNIAINDPLLVRRYQMDQDAKREEAFRLSLAETKGEKRGFERGEKKGKKANQLENARRMKADGMDPVLIAKYTGLPESEVLQL